MHLINAGLSTKMVSSYAVFNKSNNVLLLIRLRDALAAASISILNIKYNSITQ
jgi:hypothetical protein